MTKHKKLKAVLDKLETKFSYKNLYTVEEYRSDSVHYTKRIPLAALDTVKTFSKLYEYKYIKVPTEDGYTYEVDEIIVKDNSDQLIEALKLLGMSVDDIEILVNILKGFKGQYWGINVDPIIRELNEIYFNHKGKMISGEVIDSDGEFVSTMPEVPETQSQWTRADLVKVALSLQGLDYFWGGKYPKKGPNPDWGKIRKVTAAGDFSTGTYQRLGLDCSGFVEWVYFQMLGKSISNYGGTAAMWDKSFPISEAELKPGDVGFYNSGGPNHIGIYIGKIDGVRAFVHAGGTTWKDAQHPMGQVIVTKQGQYYNGYPPSNFRYFRRFNVEFLDDRLEREAKERIERDRERNRY